MTDRSATKPFGAGQSNVQIARNLLGDFVLHVENVDEFADVLLAPDAMIVARVVKTSVDNQWAPIRLMLPVKTARTFSSLPTFRAFCSLPL